MLTKVQKSFRLDKSLISRLFVSTSDRVTAENPDGWLFPELGGVENYVNRCFDTMKFLGSKRMILWDGEGQKYPQYIGSPERCPLIINQFIKPFVEAGIEVGFCIRPLEWINGVGATTPKDCLLNLYEHALVAHKRFKATLFYVDTNFFDLGAGPVLPADMFENLHYALPGCVFIPEHAAGVEYGVWTAQYRSVKYERQYTTPSLLQMSSAIRGSVSVVELGEDDDLYAPTSSWVREGLKSGEVIPMLGGTWHSARVDEVNEFLESIV
jgi:hypothetical protein